MGLFGSWPPQPHAARPGQGGESWFAGIQGAAGGRLVPVLGGVFIRGADDTVLGAVGVAGEVDEALAAHGIEAIGLKADSGGSR